jgi:hypothetical protein
MRKKQIIAELETIAEHNHHVDSLLKLYKGGYKPLDETMLEMVAIMAFDTYTLREALNRCRAKKENSKNIVDDS